MVYPRTEKADRHETLHGVTIPDPWAWMDEPGDQRLLEWLADQQALVSARIGKLDIRGDVSRILERLPANVPQQLPQWRKSRWFRVMRADAGYCRVMVGADVEARIAWDGETQPPDDDQHVRLAAEFVSVSPLGHYIALPFVKPGTDEHLIYVWDCKAKRFLDGCTSSTILPVVAWHPAEHCFFFSLSTLGSGSSQSKVGVACCNIRPRMQLEEELVFDYSEGPGHAVLPCVLQGGDYLLLKTLDFVTQQAGLLYRLLDDTEARVQPLIEGLRAPFTILGIVDGQLYIETRDKAPCGRVVTCSLASAKAEWREVIPETDHVIVPTSHSCVSRSSVLLEHYLVITYLEDVRSVVVLHDMEGRILRRINLPESGSVLEILADEQTRSLHLAVTSYLTPYAHFRYAVDEERWHVEEHIPLGIDLPEVSERQYFCASRDGARVPMTVLRPAQVAGSESPVLIYGYGGWGSCLVPQYRPELLVWLALGGTYVVVNTRGGGEYGEFWHKEGQGKSKKQVFEDFEAAAEYLQARGIAHRERTAIHGLSNGGLLVTAVVNRRPELFTAAVAEVPLVDVVHLMRLPIGSAVAAELGDPDADASMFEYMLSYSPLQNVAPNEHRPAVLVIAAGKDDRALPTWIYRYVAAMQDTAFPGQEVLLRLIEQEGHVGWPPDILRAVMIDKLAFLWRHVGNN